MGVRGRETSGVSKMSLQLLLLNPNGDEHARLDMTQLCSSSLSARLISDVMSVGTMSAETVAGLGARFTQFLSQYRLDRPAFPRDALFQFTELGPYWAQLVIEAEVLYASGSPEFDAALEELVATVQADMEGEHWIPFNKHRYFDSLLCFKAEADRIMWRCAASEIVGVPAELAPWEYAYLAERCNAIQNAAAVSCWGRWEWVAA
jgi:hypothetical protein